MNRLIRKLTMEMPALPRSWTRATKSLPRVGVINCLAWGMVCCVSIAGAFVIQETHNLPHTHTAALHKPGNRDDAARLNNLGVARMDRQEDELALRLFERAYAEDPSLLAARLNQGIALLNLQRYEAARKILEQVAQNDPKDSSAWYNLGLLEKASGRTQAALEDFGRVAEIDPTDADTQYFLGLVHAELKQNDEAIAAFERALELRPYHASAEFGMAQAYQRKGDESGSKEHLARFQHLIAEKLATPMGVVYGEQGKHSVVVEVTGAVSAVPLAIPVHFTVATSAAGLARAKQNGGAARPQTAAAFLGAGACFFDYDGDGRPDVFLVDADGRGDSALYHNVSGKFVDVTRAAGLAMHGQGMGCATGDYDNDGHTDLAVSFNGRVALYRNQGNGTFKDVTQAAGIHMDGLAMGLTFVDYDHDGDLDLYVTRAVDFPANSAEQALTVPASAHPAGNVLWRNNGNKTFTDWTEQTGLSGGGAASFGAVASDVNNDRAIDLVVTRAQMAPVVYLNRREGPFVATEPWGEGGANPAGEGAAHQGGAPAGAAGAVAIDFDKDGWMDLAFTHSSAPALTLWRNVAGKNFERVALPPLDWTRAWGVAALDYDNDGWVDLVAVGEGPRGGGIVLLRNEGAKGFRDVTHETGLDKIALHQPRAVAVADYDGDGAPDLLITQNGGPPVLLRNVGGSRNGWLRLALNGTHDSRSAIGTKVEVYAGAARQKFEIAGASGYLGQSAAEITVGLGAAGVGGQRAAQQADVVRLLWPTGVLQDEVQLRARKNHTITEIDRRGSSCPIVFAWDGTRFEFLADMVGPGIVGHWIGPNQRDIPDPTEYLKVAGNSVRARNGLLSFRMLEPMEELDYLDQVRLLAVDHPAGIAVTPNEYFASNPPFPEFKVIASQGARLPAGAWDEAGRDVLPELAHRDRKYVMSFAEAPFQGFAAMHTLELNLGPWEASRPLRLLLDGFTDYFTANSMYAAWQSGIQPIAPYVEALTPTGEWKRVMDDMGFPAGLARTMVADLTGHVPAGTRRIRIVTNLKIYWDRILVDNSPVDLPYRVTEVPLATARLQFKGYPRVIEGHPRNDITYVYEDVSATGPYTRQTGNYTRYGDIKELVQAADEKYVIYGSGDEVAADFDPHGLPPLPAGWVRDYFFYADGFAKDMDFYAAYGDTVDPLPFHTLVPYPYPPGVEYPQDESHLKYLLEYNTRAVAGPAGEKFRFMYRNKSMDVVRAVHEARKSAQAAMPAPSRAEK